MGRPKGSGKKGKDLHIRLSDNQKEKLKKYAEQEGITISEAIDRFISGLNVEPKS